jgi:TldD protein
VPEPTNDPAFDLATTAVEAALAAGASYADARVIHGRAQSLHAQNGNIESIDDGEKIGLGVRALVGSSWGFASTAELTTKAAGRAGAESAATAKASALVPGPPLELADVPVARDTWQTAVQIDPFALALSTKADLLTSITKTMSEVEGVAVATAKLQFWATTKWFVSSQGHRIHQHLVESGGGMGSMAVDGTQTQQRSYPQAFGDYSAGGWEVIVALDFAAHAERVASEAVALLTADECPSTTTNLILDSSQVALQIHESVGHAIELDRILGWEAAFAGTSFLDLAQLGSLQYGSELMNITADATIPGAMGTFAYDDEGTPGQSVDIVRDGTWVGVLSGRDSAHHAGLAPGGMVRCEAFDRLPMVRMTNIGLKPGEGSADDVIADTDDGIYMAQNRSWSIDDRRLNFQFGCEIAWEVKNGEVGRMLRNPTYTGITPKFWGSLDRLAGQQDWRAWGLPNCGKGQPMQTMHTAHPAVTARFAGVRVGVRA